MYKFVDATLKLAQERMERRYSYKAKGYNLGWLEIRVAELLGIDVKEISRGGKYPKTVQARSVLCYFAVRELGHTTVQLAKDLGLSQPTVSQAVARGERIVVERGFQFTEGRKQ